MSKQKNCYSCKYYNYDGGSSLDAYRAANDELHFCALLRIIDLGDEEERDLECLCHDAMEQQ